MNDHDLSLLIVGAIRRWLRRIGLPGAVVAFALLVRVELPMAEQLATAEIRQTMTGILTSTKQAEQQWQARQRVERK